MNRAELILIVEDNEPSRLLVRDVLEATGYRTAEARTAEEGLRLARESRPALILMDIHLPGMSGVDALQHLRGDPATRGIPVMAVTASAMTTTVRASWPRDSTATRPSPSVCGSCSRQ